MVPPTQACHGTFLTEEQHQILEWATADSGLAHQGERSSVRWEITDLSIGPYNVSLYMYMLLAHTYITRGM